MSKGHTVSSIMNQHGKWQRATQMREGLQLTIALFLG